MYSHDSKNVTVQSSARICILYLPFTSVFERLVALIVSHVLVG